MTQIPLFIPLPVYNSYNLSFQSNTSIIKIDNLTSNTYYNITATIINSNNEYINTSRMEQFKTLTWNYKPGDIIDIEVAQFTSNSIDKRYVDAFITWKPSKGNIKIIILE